MSHAVAPETMGAYVLRKVLASPPMVEVSGPQACIDPRRRRGDAGGTARSHVEPGQVVIQKHDSRMDVCGSLLVGEYYLARWKAILRERLQSQPLDLSCK